ncbi:kelch-like protein diablo [Episyrphus balteatus]|uniref:kelch-like protein diablo n=1 Tax=Episyrphus balteatus TaxID=286459 RepID=UPI002485B11D|nr:kelch-like protein diablo [Episyrphus balteatus]
MSNIEVQQSLTDKTAVIRCENRRETLSKMQLFFEQQRFCDVELIAAKDNFRISAHRIILSAASEYFLGLLQKPEITELTIDDVDGNILKLLLNFIYTASIEISSETVYDIMRTSSLFKLNTVEAECSEFLSRSLDKTNCLGVALNCKENNYRELFEKAFMFAAQHFIQIIDEEEFLTLELELLVQLLKRNDLCVRSEEDVFRGIIRWIEHDKTNRESHSMELLSYLRFPLLTPEFIVNKVGDALPAPEFQVLIMKALKWHMSPANRASLFSEELCRPRNQRGQLILIKSGTELEMPLNAEVFDPITGAWSSEEWPAKPEPCWYTNGILINEKVYLACTTVVGGRETNCVHCYDLETQEWTVLPPMIGRRFSFGMAELNGQLYAVGGHNGTDNLYSVEKWDPNSPQRWQEVAPMQKERNQPGVTVCNGLMYAIGSTGDFDHNSFEFYDPQTNTWAELTPPIQARTSVGLCVVKGLLYAVGGRTETGICTMIERYDFQSDTWSEISPSGKFQQYIQCVTWMNRLLVLVEMNEGEFKHIVEEYNPETGKWRVINSFGKDHGTAILVSNRI